jgi:hypothetical protein
MFLWLAIILAAIWVVGYLAFHVAGSLIHLLVLLAVISVVVHLVRRSSRTIGRGASGGGP